LAESETTHGLVRSPRGYRQRCWWLSSAPAPRRPSQALLVGNLPDAESRETARLREPELETSTGSAWRRRSARHGKAGQGRTDAGIAITGAASGPSLQGRVRRSTHYSQELPGDRRRLPLFQMPTLRSPFSCRLSAADDLARDPATPEPAVQQMPPAVAPRSYLAAPVRSSHRELLGGASSDIPIRFFHERDERLIAGLAAHAAIALDNAQLYRRRRRPRPGRAANGLKDEFWRPLSRAPDAVTPSSVGRAAPAGKLSPDETTRAVDTIIATPPHRPDHRHAARRVADHHRPSSKPICGRVTSRPSVNAAIGRSPPATEGHPLS